MNCETLELLISKNIKFLNMENFKVITLDHSGGNIKGQQKIIHSLIPQELGLYIYVSANENKVLYVGEGDLRTRFRRHINKTKPEHKQIDERNVFFHVLKIEMKIFYIEASVLNLNKKKIQLLESALKLLLNPIYDQMVEKKVLCKDCKININEWEN